MDQRRYWPKATTFKVNYNLGNLDTENNEDINDLKTGSKIVTSRQVCFRSFSGNRNFQKSRRFTRIVRLFERDPVNWIPDEPDNTKSVEIIIVLHTIIMIVFSFYYISFRQFIKTYKEV